MYFFNYIFRKAKKNFENYCAPLLHLAGMYVSVVETETEGHGRDIVAKLDPQTEAIIVAGGDGTLSEVRYIGNINMYQV